MADPLSVNDIDLSPPAGKTYINLDREWREEFIYFLLIDRFQDDAVRPVVTGAGRSAGIATPNSFYGGTIKGVTGHLDYIAGLGCTAIWLSPVFENNPGAYHGYNTNNYLAIDPHFGTKQDLIDLVEAAHSFKRHGEPFPIRVILDVVINHSGDNWFYAGGAGHTYQNDIIFALGDFRRADRPIPTELRNSDWYHQPKPLSPEPNVRIQLPPADSLRLAGFRPPTPRNRAFPAGVRGGAGGAVGRDRRDAMIWRRLAGISLPGHIPVPQCRRCGSQQCRHWPASEVGLPRGVAISASFTAQRLRQSRARSAARASQAADASAPAVCLRSDRAAGALQGWLR
jgi:hypothetical protein